ncbi:MAG: prepilin-type N-terminal cleavage/methylation domain-containing protein [Tepidisphaeraceae bacterium]
MHAWANPIRNPARRAGFTLMELLVVMGILVILLVIALPIFDYITGARSAEAGVNVASAMVGRARALALNREDDKYVGVLFYNEPDTDRDAMQIVEVDAGDIDTSLERYVSWQNSASYRQAIVTPPQRPADVVYSQVLDPTLGGAGSPYNNRPVVKRFEAIADSSGAGSHPANGTTFTNAYWGVRVVGNTIPVSLDAEVQYLPKGVRARVLMRRNAVSVSRPGMILFDKQGHVVVRRWGISRDSDTSIDGGEKLLDAMGFTTDLPITNDRESGIALTLFNEKDTGLSDLKDQAAIDTWVRGNATQYTVGLQTGELISVAQN